MSRVLDLEVGGLGSSGLGFRVSGFGVKGLMSGVRGLGCRGSRPLASIFSELMMSLWESPKLVD